MSDETNKGGDAAFVTTLADVEWGFVAADGNWVELPKMPLVLSGYRQPPFNVTMPGGQIRHIVERGRGDAADIEIARRRLREIEQAPNSSGRGKELEEWDAAFKESV